MTYAVEVVPGFGPQVISETPGPVEADWQGVIPGVVEIVEPAQIATVIEVQVPGFPGPPGSGSAPILAAERIELSEDQTTIYRGESLHGADESAATWRIRKVILGYGNLTATTATWPNGSKEFSFRWDQRATYSYT